MFITSLNYVMNLALTSLMITSWKGYLKSFAMVISGLVTVYLTKASKEFVFSLP